MNLERLKLLQYSEECVCNFALNCLQELSEEIEDYTQRFNTEDQLEWNLVLQEVAAFVEVTTLQHVT